MLSSKPERVKSQYPRARYLGIAEGGKDNGSFLKRHTNRQLLAFFHVTEYLARVAWAAYPRRSPSQAEVKTGQPERQQWLHDRCHPLKHEPDAARDMLTEMRAFKHNGSASSPQAERIGAWGCVVGDSLLRKPLAADEVLGACTGQSFDGFGGYRSGLQDLGEATAVWVWNALERHRHQGGVESTGAGSNARPLESVLGES